MENMENQGTRKPFAAFIQEQRGGGLHGELSHELANLVNAVQETQKPGTLTLTLKVAPNKDGVTVTVSDKIKAAVPEADRGAAIFFVQGDGNLVRRDPRQTELPLRVVDKETGEVRDLDAAGDAS
jgi:hypothetical protein